VVLSTVEIVLVTENTVISIVSHRLLLIPDLASLSADDGMG
jgi:hypothetical protein